MQLKSGHEGSTNVTIHEASQHHFRVEHISILTFFFTLKLLLSTTFRFAFDLGKPTGWASLHCHMILLPYSAAAGACLILGAVCSLLMTEDPRKWKIKQIPQY